MDHKKYLAKLLLFFLFVQITGVFQLREVSYAAPANHILISEVEYDSTVTENEGEWIELYNPTAGAVSLSGWTLGEAAVGVEYTFTGGVSIAAGSFLLVVNDTATFNGEHAGIVPDIDMQKTDSPSCVSDLECLRLNNDSGDSLTLKDDFGTTIDFVAWEGLSGFDVNGDAGFSICRRNLEDTDTDAEWSNNCAPTPGTGSFVTVSPGGIPVASLLWSKMDAETYSHGDTMTVLNDRSGNDRDGTNHGTPSFDTTNTINFNPTASFDGTSDGFDFPSYTLPIGDKNYSMYAVFQSPLTQDDMTLHYVGRDFSTNNSTFTQLDSNGSAHDDFDNGIANLNSSPVASVLADTPQMLSFNYSSVNDDKAMFLNGESIATMTGVADHNASNSASSDRGIGYNADGSTDYFLGNIAEVVSFDTELDTTSRMKIDSYLAIKYGITLDAAPLPMISQRETTGNTTWGSAIASNQRGQSFTVTQTGYLDSIFFNVSNIAGGGPGGTMSLEIYEGDGFAGTLLHSQTGSYLLGANTFILDESFPLDNGGIYTFKLLNDINGGLVYSAAGNEYTGGMMYFGDGTSPLPAADLVFDINIANEYLGPDATSLFALDRPDGYVSDVFGIGRSDDSSLDQQISSSVNSGSILTISTDTDFSGLNGTHADILTDGQYLVVGSNLGLLATQTGELDTGSFLDRIGREWRVQNTGTVGNVNIKFDGFDENSMLLTDADGDFSTGATNEGALSASGVITLTLNDGEYFTLASPIPNLAPTDIDLSGSGTIDENSASGSSIGSLTTTDPNVADTHTYSFASGTGDTDNASFSLSGTELLIQEIPDFETQTGYTIRLETDDGNGGNYEEIFLIGVNDLDDEVPVISLVGTGVVEVIKGYTYTDSGATFSDNVDGTGAIVGSGTVNTSMTGAYLINYNYSDVAGNAAIQVTRTVNVIAGDTPVINLIGSGSIDHEQGTSYTDSGATYSDTEDGTGAVVGSGTIDTATLGMYTLYYDFTDLSDNDALQVTRTVNVVDTTSPPAPEFLSISEDTGTSTGDFITNDSMLIFYGSGEADSTVTFFLDGVYSSTGQVSGTGSFEFDDSAGTGAIDGSYVVTFSLEDASGNTGALSTPVTIVIDTIAPLIDVSGSGTINLMEGAIFIDPGANFSDAVDGTGALVGSGSVNTAVPGTYTIYYNYTDTAGNPAIQVTRTVIVSPNTVSSGGSGGGGGGGGGSSSPGRSKDSCPDGDKSKSYYDGTCEAEKSIISQQDLSPILSGEEREQEEDSSTLVEDKGDYTITQDHCPMTDNILSDTYNANHQTQFSDTGLSQYQEAIHRLEKVGIVKGRENGIFDPNSEITRAEFLAIVLQAHCYDISQKPKTLPFTDVEIAHWHSNVIGVGLEHGIISGDLDEAGKRVFRGDDSISKIEAFAIMMNMRRLTLDEERQDFVHSYTDVAADWQNSYLNTGEALEILDPTTTSNTFSPNLKIPRDQLVGLLIDIMNLY